MNDCADVVSVACFCGCGQALRLNRGNMRRCVVEARRRWPDVKHLAFDVHDIPAGLDYTKDVSHRNILALIRQAAKVYQ